jgi:hypothetical protein
LVEGDAADHQRDGGDLDRVGDLGERTGGRRFYTHSAPLVWPPRESFTDVRRTASTVLPSARYRRHHLWRYTLVWHRPADN